jgi:hypothetical protein
VDAGTQAREARRLLINVDVKSCVLKQSACDSATEAGTDYGDFFSSVRHDDPS